MINTRIKAFGLASFILVTSCRTTNPSITKIDSATSSHTFTFVNSCKEDVWVGFVGQNGSPPLFGGGYQLSAGDTKIVLVPVGHSGRIWPRTGCTFNADGHCASGNCCLTGGCLESDNKTFGLKCGYSGAAPVSLLEWTLDATSGFGPIDYYDMSFVDGWSVPISIEPVAGTYNTEKDPGIGSWWCEQDGCTASAPICPQPFQVNGSPLSCNSPCQAAVNAKSADAEKLCCTCSLTDPITCPESKCAGHYGCTPYHTPSYPSNMTCNPWDPDPNRSWDSDSLTYISAVHSSCPKVYAWQFDDVKATFNCRRTNGLVDYKVEFCPIIFP